MSDPSDYKPGQILTATELNGSLDEKTTNANAKINGGYADNLDHVTIVGTTDSVSTGSGALIVTGGVGVGSSVNVGGKLSVADIVKFTSSTASNSAATGALVVSGGVGIGQSLNVGGGLNVAGKIAANDATDATSAATGGLVAAGGLGVAKSAWIGANLHVQGVLSASGGATVTGDLSADSVTLSPGGKIIFGDGTEQVTKAMDEAPLDTSVYGRSNGAWVVLPNLPEAPADGSKYGRKDNAWTVLTDIDEAPMDGNQYSRKDGAWSQTFASGMWMGDAPPADTVRYPQWWDTATGNFYVWYTDANSSQWVLSLPGNIGPQGLIADANADGAIYGRQNGAWTVLRSAAGQTLLPDGTVAAPGLAFASEIGLGLFRKQAGKISVASGGSETYQFDASGAANTIFYAFPRAPGAASLVARNAPPGNADNTQVRLTVNADGTGTLGMDIGGAATKKQFNFVGSSRWWLDAPATIPEGVGGGYAITVPNYHQSGSNYFVDILTVNPNWNVNGMYMSSIFVPSQWAGFRFGANAGGSMDFYLHDANSPQIVLNGATAKVVANRFQGCADTALYLRNDANPGGQTMKFTWTDPGGQSGYFWGGDDGANMRLTHRNNMTVGRVNTIDGASGGNVTSQINITGGPTASNYGYDCTAGGNFRSNKSSSHWWRWHWNDPDSNLYAFVDDNNVGWVTRNSDERLKEDIVPMESDTAAFMRLQPINFRWKKIGAITNNDLKMDGLSAQNVKENFPMAAFGDFETPPKEDGTMDFPGAVDDRAMVAHCIAQIQKLITRMDAMEAKA